MKKMTHHITLKLISIILLSLILMTTSLQIVSMLKIKSDVLQIQALWDHVQVEQSEKLRLENSIRRLLGFGGMIHKLKDLILTDNIDQLEDITSDIQSVETIIKLYLTFQITTAERYALHDISKVLKIYQAKNKQLLYLFKQNVPQHKLAQFMFINDKPALQGLEILKQYNHILRNHENNHKHKKRQNTHVLLADKFIQLTDLIAQLGYGGLIHNIKDFQLRGNGTYALAAQNNIDKIKKILSQYAQAPLTIKEKKALKSILHGTDFYQIILKTLKQPIENREAVLFVALKRIDKTTTHALQVLHQHIERELQEKITEIGKNIHSIHSTINTLILVISLFSLISLLFFAYIMFQKVIMPLQKVTLAMVVLARHGHKKESIFTSHKIFEIKQMIRSIRIFRKNESKRHHTSKSLTKMNQTTLQQLDKITDLQHKSEQKTEQALTLANHLIELQKSAEIDRNNALDNQERVNMILNTVHDAIITTDNEGFIESLNTATELMFGYHKSELLAKNINQLMPDDDPLISSKSTQHLNNNGSPSTAKYNQEKIIKRADGTFFPVDIFLGQSMFNNAVTYTAVISDITQRKKDEEAIQKLILTDPLTNLANRRHFNQALISAVKNAQRLNLSVGLLMIDLDDFKSVNDTYGHHTGDQVLQLVSRRFEKITRNVDLIARLGGDEFAIILNNITKSFDPFTVAQKIVDSIAQPIEINDQLINTGATIGISVLPEEALNLDDFIHHADKALYKAKSLGKGRYFLYQHLADDEK